MFKSKQFWFIFLKWALIVLLSFYIMSIFSSDTDGIRNSFELLKTKFQSQKIILGIIVLLTFLNWFFEILKWQKLVGIFQKISFSRSVFQTLTSHSLSMITPFKTGDYVFKTLFYNKEYRLKIIGLNALGNMVQLLITVVFGMVGIFILIHYDVFNFGSNSTNLMFLIGLGILIFLILSYFFFSSNWYQGLKTKWVNISKNVLFEVFLFSLIRYLLFSHQFYLILSIYGVELPYFQIIGVLFSMYLISSFLPVFTLFDFVIKGSVALFLFSKFEVNQSMVLVSTTLMWFLNFVLPALVGLVLLTHLKKENLQLNPKME